MGILALPLPLSGANWFDASAAVLLLLLGWRGYRKGALGWLASLGASLLALVTAFALAPAVSELIAGRSSLGRLLTERITFLVLLLLLRMLLGWAMRELVLSIRPLLRALPPLDFVDHLLGIIPSLLIGVIIVLIALAASILLPVDRRVREAATRSYVGRLATIELARASRSLSQGGVLSAPERILDLERGLSAIQTIGSGGKVS